MTDAVGQASSEESLLAWRVGRHMLANSPVIAHWGFELLDMAPGYSRLTMTIRDDMANPFGVCHGGVLFTFADTCFGLACNSHNAQAVGASCDIRYLQPARVGDEVIATATEVWLRGRSSLYDVAINRADGEQISILRGYARILGEPLVESQ